MDQNEMVAGKLPYIVMKTAKYDQSHYWLIFRI